MKISSLESLISYLTTQGVKILEVYTDAIRVTEDLFLVYDGEWVIPTGFDSEGFLFEFTNDIKNLFINYLFE